MVNVPTAVPSTPQRPSHIGFMREIYVPGQSAQNAKLISPIHHGRSIAFY
jgi:hypothetical protein